MLFLISLNLVLRCSRARWCAHTFVRSTLECSKHTIWCINSHTIFEQWYHLERLKKCLPSALLISLMLLPPREILPEAKLKHTHMHMHWMLPMQMKEDGEKEKHFQVKSGIYENVFSFPLWQWQWQIIFLNCVALCLLFTGNGKCEEAKSGHWPTISQRCLKK